jgi:hypothetical protein
VTAVSSCADDKHTIKSAGKYSGTWEAPVLDARGTNELFECSACGLGFHRPVEFAESLSDYRKRITIAEQAEVKP